ncbi:MAG: hypothetical protein CMH94_06650 [Oceanicaulis sp.]|nr:hypothetical protein [Maricaulis sp.]MBI75267.1 hypothetical protein [Oceanicaulis sp.]
MTRPCPTPFTRRFSFVRLALPVLTGVLAVTLTSTSPAFARQDDLQALLSAPVGVERTAPVSSVPFETRVRKFYLDASVNGETHEFIFDTGSPTIVSRQLADALGLEIVGRNTGRDANGTPVTMDFAIIDRLTLGDVTFTRVPVLIHDFSGLATGACLIDGGVIGSEILPGSAWRIDAAAGRLEIAESAAALAPLETVLSAPLHDFGYPHAPVLDYALGEIADKALFDTGSEEEVVLFHQVADSRPARAHIVRGSVVTGQGSEGESAGGRSENRELVRFSLEDFRIGETSPDPVRATTRTVPPSLVGAGMMDRFIVTLDYPGAAFTLSPRDAPAPERVEPGFALAFAGEGVEVVQLFEGSPADEAGLRLGDRVTAIDGRALGGHGCEDVHWLMGEYSEADGGALTVERAGETMVIEVPPVR